MGDDIDLDEPDVDNTIIGNNIDITNPSRSLVFGKDINTSNLHYAKVFGNNLTAKNSGMTSIGQHNHGISNETMFELGTGLSAGEGRKNGIEIYRSGRVRAPELSMSVINSDTEGNSGSGSGSGVETGLGARTLITKEWFFENNKSPIDEKLAYTSITNMVYDGSDNLTEIVYATGNKSFYYYTGSDLTKVTYTDEGGVVIVLTIDYVYNSGNRISATRS